MLAHLIEHGVDDAGERVADIFAALDVLLRNPMIDRPAELAMREPILGRGARADSTQQLHPQPLRRLGIEGDDVCFAICRQTNDQTVVQIDAALGIAL
jgi:hypothetical protein